MKTKKITIAILSAVLLFPSCDNWLQQENQMGFTEDQAYKDEAGINSIASNFYSRLRYWQDFGYDSDSYDLTRWDEASNGSQYWNFANNVGSGYREYYDYGFLRELNIHIRNLETLSAGVIAQDKLKYYLAEARFFRAFTYFRMVTQYGGVPLITQVTEYRDDPTELALPRNTEAELYDFIINEMDEVKGDFGTATSKTRASHGAALALKCRAALYAGTLAYNFDLSAQKTLNLASGATGIPKAKAEGYLKACIDACAELESLGYTLYAKQANLADNYAEAFVVAPANNPELIFCKAYDAVNVKNYFTQRAISRSLTIADKSGAQVTPVLNLVKDYELVSSRRAEELDVYVGQEQLEILAPEVQSSEYDYVLYNSPLDLFAGRDPRLAGSVLLPGASFRGRQADLRAGLALPRPGGGYDFKSAQRINDVATASYQGVKLTGNDGPLCMDDNSSNWYIGHTGFLMRKFVDPAGGSEAQGNSSVPYPVFRLGEAYLNAAEAAFYLSNLGVASYNNRPTKTLALDYLNKVRERAGGSAFRLTESELDFNRIVNERRVELSFEDHRYYDLKRWRVADEWWYYDVNNPTAAIYVLWPYQVYAPGDARDGKWIFRKMKATMRANNAILSFTNTMYYNNYPMNEGNPYIEKNPNH